MTLEQFVAALHKYVEDNAVSESKLFTPDPLFLVEAVGLLDFVYRTTGLEPPKTPEARVKVGLKP